MARSENADFLQKSTTKDQKKDTDHILRYREEILFEQAKVSMLTGNTLLHVAAVQFESEFRGKFICRALHQFKKAIELSPSIYKPRVLALQSDLIDFIKRRI